MKKRIPLKWRLSDSMGKTELRGSYFKFAPRLSWVLWNVIGEQLKSAVFDD